MKPLAQERASAADAKDTRAQRIEAVVVSSDDALLIELGPVLGNRYRTHTVDAPGDINTTLQASRWLGIVDTASLPDARGAIARMELQFHRCPLIVVAAHPEEWAAAIARGAITAALSRDDLAGPRLTEALAAAELRLRSQASPDSAVTPASAQSRRSGAPKLLAMLLGVAVVLGVLGASAWWLLHRPRAHDIAASAASSQTGSAGASSAPATAAPVATKPQTVLELLSAARVAFSDQKLLLPRTDAEPHGDSALELYTQVLSQEPGNDEALDGVKRLFAAGKSRIQTDLASGKLDDASRLLGYFKAAGVSPEALRDIDASISAAKPKWVATRAQQDIAAGDLVTADQLIGQLTASGATPNVIAELRRALDAKKLETQLTAMATQVKAAIDAGALLDPASDNARTRFAAMRNLARSQPLTLSAQHELQGALLGRGQQATREGQFDLAQRYINAAAELSNSTDTSDAKRQLQAAMDAAAQRSAAAAAATKAQRAAAAAATAAPAHTASPGATQADANVLHYIAARPTRAFDITYPDGATAAGYVIVEFTLAANGTASNLTVVEAQPRGVFEQTALNAVRRGHYDTRELVERQPARARIRLRFKPN